MRLDDEPLEDGCGRRVGINGSGFYCTDHDTESGEHVWRGEGQASRGLGHADNLTAGLEVRWRDDRPAATVGDARRAIAKAREWKTTTAREATR